jgi:hypothetical protein
MTMSNELSSMPKNAGALKPFAWVVLAVAGLLALGLPGQAQEQTGGELWRFGGCFNCHGLMADGQGDAAYPVGPSLRRTALDRDQLIETIACGRPDTPMPMHLEGGYTEVACYEMPLGQVPNNVIVGSTLTAEQIETLVDFLVENVVGQARVTRENCATFYDGNLNAPACFQY